MGSILPRNPEARLSRPESQAWRPCRTLSTLAARASGSLLPDPIRRFLLDRPSFPGPEACSGSRRCLCRQLPLSRCECHSRWVCRHPRHQCLSHTTGRTSHHLGPWLGSSLGRSSRSAACPRRARVRCRRPAEDRLRPGPPRPPESWASGAAWRRPRSRGSWGTASTHPIPPRPPPRWCLAPRTATHPALHRLGLCPLQGRTTPHHNQVSTRTCRSTHTSSTSGSLRCS
mmetsp:Transcript_85532/g.245645  ORF Transcript_85532/g.245645 Transcript_85532/m.245645 type:complete len:229 (+) Transcript_85532:676-1362(+)